MSKIDLSHIRLETHEKQPPAGFSRGLWVSVFVVLVVLVIVIGLIVRSFRTDENDTPVVSASNVSSVDPPPASPPDQMTSPVSAGGYVEARRMALLLPGSDGIVANIFVMLGQEVDEGTLLLELVSDTEEAEVAMEKAALNQAESRLDLVLAGPRPEEIEAAAAEVNAAEARLGYALRELSRFETLDATGVVSTASVEETRSKAQVLEAELKALRARENMLRLGSRPEEQRSARAEKERAEASLQLAEVRLELKRLRAPFKGTIVRLALEPGEIVSRWGGIDRQKGVEIADLSELWIRVDVPETRIGRIALGDPAEAFISAVGERPLLASVVEILPIADRQSNTVEVAVRLDDPPPLVFPDMSARVTIKK